MNGIEFLLDTNVVVGLLKGHDAVIALAEHSQLDLSRAAVSQITRMELLSFNALSDHEEFEIRQFLACCRVLMIDDLVESEAIMLRRRSKLKLPDAVIAATAAVHSLRLLTLDQRLSTSTRPV